MDPREYRDSGVGRFQVRILGLVFSAVAVSMLAVLFNIRIPEIPGPNLIGVPANWLLGVLTCLGSIGCGVVMLLNPKWWIRKYFRPLPLTEHSTALAWTLRAGGLLFIGTGASFLINFLIFRR